MNQLKILLHYRSLIIVFLLLYMYIFINFIGIGTKYDETNNEIIGYIDDINIDGNKITLEVIANEKILINYYVDDIKQLNVINNYKLGDYVEVKGTIKKANDNSIFNLFSYKKYLYSKKIYWILDAKQITKIKSNNMIRYKIKNSIINRINNVKNTSHYLKAFILGDTSEINDLFLENYRNIGISHLFAISGTNITLLIGIIMYILRNNKFKNIIVILLLIYNVFLTGYSASILRATLLYILIFFNKKYNLNIKTYDLLLLTAAIILIYNPYYIYNIGFLFSFSISLYLILFKKLINKYNNYYSKLMIISLISFLVSIPIMINNFFNINLLSIIFNLFFVPFVSLLVFPMSLITFIFPYLDNILLHLINILEESSVFCSKIKFLNITLAAMPIYVLILYYFVITSTIYGMQKGKYGFFILLVIILFIHSNIAHFNRYSSITIIDVGQGDAILISLKHNKGNILIDTGGIVNYIDEEWKKRNSNFSLAKNSIIPYLKSIGIKKLDYLIVTHGDNDHIGEGINLVENFKIDNVLLNSGQDQILEENFVEHLSQKKIIFKKISKHVLKINGYIFNFINDTDIDNENEDSLIIYTKLDGKNILLMGDAGESSEKYIIDEYNLPIVDILKVGHHGSKYSSSEVFLDAIKPKFALISAGVNNRFNHPHEETIDRFKKQSINYFSTSINGTIKVVLKPKIIVYTCY